MMLPYKCMLKPLHYLLASFVLDPAVNDWFRLTLPGENPGSPNLWGRKKGPKSNLIVFLKNLKEFLELPLRQQSERMRPFGSPCKGLTSSGFANHKASKHYDVMTTEPPINFGFQKRAPQKSPSVFFFKHNKCFGRFPNVSPIFFQEDSTAVAGALGPILAEDGRPEVQQPDELRGCAAWGVQGCSELGEGLPGAAWAAEIRPGTLACSDPGGKDC